MFLITLHLIATTDQPVLSLTVRQSGLWIASETLPPQLDPLLIDQLYSHLVEDTRSCRVANSELPIVFHIAANGDQRFPYGAEGFAGLTGMAWATCPLADVDDALRDCQLSLEALNPLSIPVQVIVLREQDDPRLEVGYLVHELTHTCGTIDGVRCPAHPDYAGARTLPTDFCDAYWWFGVSGVFTFTPDGMIWDALHHHCEATTEPALCEEYEQMFAGVNWEP